MITGIIIAILITGGAWGAENSLPGDLLYPVKVSVNEKVVSAVLVSDESEAKWQIKLEGRRIAEAEELASEGKLNAETAAKLSAEFKEHEKSADEHTDKVKNENDKAEIKTEHEAALQAHARVIAELSQNMKEDTRIHLTNLFEDIDEKLSESRGSREDGVEKIEDNSPNAQSAALGKKTAAENKIKEVKAFIASKQASLSADLKAKVSEKISQADKEISEGNIKLEAKAYADAFEKYQKAIKLAQEAKEIIDPSVSIKLETDNDGDGDDDNGTRIESKTKVEVNI